ncbi:hypothetical protein OTU49_015112 [Cherax quadricarinatus]|uniref:Uncharacterized protein n=1 Tax=Cherax quadricarinatus TaxID=27406 RepID=A0AAW0Y1J7_CHEQU
MEKSKEFSCEDSDSDSYDDFFPCLGNESGVNMEDVKSSRMDIESLVKAEVSDRHTDAFLVNIAKELKLFDDSTENETKPLVLELPVDIDVKQQRNVVLQPPGVPFFTKRHHHLYTEDTLIWPFQKTPQILADLKPPKIKKYICEDWFMVLI